MIHDADQHRLVAFVMLYFPIVESNHCRMYDSVPPDVTRNIGVTYITLPLTTTLSIILARDPRSVSVIVHQPPSHNSGKEQRGLLQVKLTYW